MGFNAKFIQEVVGVISSSRVTLELGDTLSPCIIRPLDDENALFVVMPVRLD